MNKLQSFIHNVLGEVRIIPSESGNPSETLFCALDVCRMLNYNENNIRTVINRMCRYVTKRDVPHPQNKDKTISLNFIQLMDVFNLAFSSRRPEAEELRRWVTDEVLPSIYFTGEYIDENHDSNFSLGNPIFNQSEITEDILSRDNTISINDSLGETMHFDSSQIAINCVNVMNKMSQTLYENQQKLANMLKIIHNDYTQLNNKIESNKHLIVPARIVEK